LLFETEFNDLLDRVLVVLADEPIRIQRIKQRDHRSLEQIQAIISSQVGDEKRISEADDIIENKHDLAAIKPQIKQLDKKYESSDICKA